MAGNPRGHHRLGLRPPRALCLARIKSEKPSSRKHCWADKDEGREVKPCISGRVCAACC
jgi:hypothetical protein